MLFTTVCAQLSPGKLHKTHAFIEGLKNCTQCHSAGNRVTPEKCLVCHTLLKKRIAAGRGLHAQPDHQQCGVCHGEHYGREFELIRWTEKQENFDHDLAGYSLEGAHAKVKCRDCHRAENIPEKASLIVKKKDLNRTFLGLSRACASCHEDEHRGQLDLNCAPCHDLNRWIPAPGFDHNATQYPLTGRHAEVACKDCHTTVTDNRFPGNPSYLQYSGVDFELCVSCHADVHRGRLGVDCERCHSTNGWNDISMKRFDHAKTRFPLRGKHRLLRCESCHKPGRPHRGIPFERCTDCHSDFHRGQFTQRASKGACEACHTEAGFSPSTFTIADHETAKFPLKGAHLAVACFVCHTGGPQNSARDRSMLKINRFVIEAVKCQDCHRDPHFGEVDRFVNIGGCEYCHRVDSWQEIVFDHSQNRFSLEGRHAEIRCGACHQPTAVGTPRERIQFVRMLMNCRDCHEDQHFGQFAQAVQTTAGLISATDCSRCHTPARWQPDKFDHNRDSRFSLVGMHENVPCKSCHQTVQREENSFVLFKPMEMACSACHDANQSK